MMTVDHIIRSDPGIPTRLLVLDLDDTVRWGKGKLGRFVNEPGDVHIFPEALERMRLWKADGGRVIAVSNQGGIALGHMTYEQCIAIMNRTQDLCGGLFDSIAFCPHFPTAGSPGAARCWCRKPSPGLVVQSILVVGFRYNESYPPHMGLFVGDREEDVQCAKLAGFDFQHAKEWRAGSGGGRLR